MAQDRFNLSSSTWTVISEAAPTDVLVAIQGAAVLCFGGTSGVTGEEGIPVGAGYQVVVPAGVSVHGMARGGPCLAYVATFGV